MNKKRVFALIETIGEEKEPIAIGPKAFCEETLKEVITSYGDSDIEQRLLQKTTFEILQVVDRKEVRGEYYAHELTNEAHAGYIDCDVTVAELETGEFTILATKICKNYPVTGISAVSNDGYKGKYDNGMGDELEVY